MSELSKYPYDRGQCIQVKTEDISFSHELDFQTNPAFRFCFSRSPQSYSSCMYTTSVSNPTSYKENNSPACRRRLDFSNTAFFDETKIGPLAVAKRNERERNRVKLINMTFHTLRQHLPHLNSVCKGKSRKLSKVQTLRSAIAYIRQLQELVHARQAGHVTKQEDPHFGDDDAQSNTDISDSPMSRRVDNMADLGKSMAYAYNDFSKLASQDQLPMMSASSPSFPGISFDLLVKSDEDILISTDDDVLISTDEDDFVDWL
ncbi:achaete-scute 1 [Biomphalaria glabrata]|uniref:Achaete-scute homolog 1-like n=1 Tax=Biomphalaria glabrata TaxID=6526 RepID=A0A182ZIY7_BIOGL|nr:achaete-scute homolog 1-like [Biomphalaria glabrata]XP_055887981.1 achaete-scute homolog 1-like [Biomphalaria glabrata]KAI8758299.1 achaete-scute-like protein 1-like [Biomphalaria glabrata]KAI8791808.1 achaete-scute 1 [Biomphalaria glabrata]